MKIQYMSDLHLEFSDNSRWLKHNELPASGKFREIPSDLELLEIPHFAPVLIEKTKQNKTTISNNLKNSMMSFRDLLKSGTNPTLQSN